jgi:hypothetical protein
LQRAGREEFLFASNGCFRELAVDVPMRVSLILLGLAVASGVLGCAMFSGGNRGLLGTSVPPSTVRRQPLWTPRTPQAPASSRPPAPPREQESAPTPTFAPETAPKPVLPAEPVEELPPLYVPAARRPNRDVQPISSQGPILEIVAPARSQIGGQTTYRLLVTNPRSTPLAGLTLRCEFDPALRFPGSDRSAVKQDLGDLEAFGVREVLLTLSSQSAGRHRLAASLRRDERELARGEHIVEFVPKTFELSLVGPERRAPGQPARYRIQLTNQDAAETSPLTVRFQADGVLELGKTWPTATVAGQTVTWSLPPLAPRESRLVAVEVRSPVPTSQAGVRVDVQGETLPSVWRQEWLSVALGRSSLIATCDTPAKPVRPGEVFQVTTIVENHGLETLAGVDWEPRLPPGVRLVGRHEPSTSNASPAAGAITLPPGGRLVTVWELAATLPGLVHLQFAASADSPAEELLIDDWVGIGETSGELTRGEVLEPLPTVAPY